MTTPGLENPCTKIVGLVHAHAGQARQPFYRQGKSGGRTAEVQKSDHSLERGAC